MSKNKFQKLSENIVNYIGSKDNVTYFVHCVTRLRFNLKDKSLSKPEEIEKLPGVLGCQWQGDELQIIIGQDVDDAYRLICKEHGFVMEDAIDEDLDVSVKKEKKKLTMKGAFSAIADIISGSLIPFIPVLIGAGMIKVLCLLLSTFGILDPASSTYNMLSIVGDAGFYFLPVFIGKGAAKKFNTDEGLGMLMGLMLVAPSFIALVDEGASITLFGLPVYAGTYSYMVFPVILCVMIMAPVERFFKKISPSFLRVIMEPFATLLVMIPLAFCVLAPLGAILGTYITAFLMWLYETTGFIGMAVLGALYPFLVITGMHNATTPYWLESFTKFGYEPIVSPIDCLNNINQGLAAAAVACKTKNKELKSTGLSCGCTAIIAGISEPSMFGVNLKYKTPLICVCIGNFFGAGLCGLLQVYCYNVYGTGGMFAIPCYIGPTATNIIFYILAMLLGGAITFIATYITFKDCA